MYLSCKECQFFHKSVCHAHPPIGNQWALVGTDDWCGEFVRKDAPQAKSERK